MGRREQNERERNRAARSCAALDEFVSSHKATTTKNKTKTNQIYFKKCV